MLQEYSPKLLRKVQLKEIEILKEVAKICDNENITYFIIAGTLLGAKRHEGFIPWDDDIDIAMPRKDYEKFLQIADELLPNNLFIQDYNREKKFPHLMAKVMMENTQFVEYCTRNINMKQGIFVDIFPYDNVRPEKQTKGYVLICRLLHDLYWVKSMPDCSLKNKPKGIKEYMNFIVIRVMNGILKIVPKNFLYSKIYKLYTKYNDDDMSTAMGIVGRDTKYYLKEDLFPVKKLNFETEVFYAPRNIVGYLENMYGDWKKLPPKEQRVGHAPCKLKI